MIEFLFETSMDQDLKGLKDLEKEIQKLQNKVNFLSQKLNNLE